ncbi:MAG: hypothetical protein WD075_02295 [Rhodospirillales bacterium]
MSRPTALQYDTTADQPAFGAEGNKPRHRRHAISDNAMENLWVRLKTGNRIRPRDAQMLRHLDVPPFRDSGIYELSANGYVIAVGMPGAAERVDDAALLRTFEGRFGIPVSFSGALRSSGRL